MGYGYSLTAATIPLVKGIMNTNMKRLLWVVAIGIIAVWILGNPTDAAGNVNSIFDNMKVAATNIITFVKQVFNG